MTAKGVDVGHYQYDLIVIGGGSGGVALARRAASYGANVAVVESSRLGGTCVHRGCVPKKLLHNAADFAFEFEVAGGYGYDVPEVPFSWPKLIANVHAELDRLLGFYTKSLDNSKVDHVQARGQIKSPHEVALDNGETLTGRYLCIAVGARPFRPDRPGMDLASVSDDMFNLCELPQRVVVQGSGYIGLEFASIMKALGSQVDLVYRSKRPLPGFDEDLRHTIAEEMQRRGVRIHCETHVTSVEKAGSGLTVHTSHEALGCDVFLAATGRVPNTKNLGLENVGVAVDRSGAVLINELRETSVSGIFALGDCTGKIQLTPYAISEGRALADRVFGGKPASTPPSLIPTAVFALPPLATVGLTEEQAVSSFGADDVEIYKTKFRPMRLTLPKMEEKVLMKLVVRRSTGLVAGAHMVGADAPEIIQALAVALTCGATKAQFDRTLALHPSVGEEFVLLREPSKPTPPPERS